jgi:predicted RNA binding protein with dsRBD fold (UPF0201 family)
MKRKVKMNEDQLKVYETVSNLLSQRRHNEREIMRHSADIRSLQEDSKHLEVAYNLAVEKHRKLGEAK